MTGPEEPFDDPLLEAIAELKAFLNGRLFDLDACAGSRRANPPPQSRAPGQRYWTAAREASDSSRERAGLANSAPGDAQQRLDDLAKRLSDKLSRRASPESVNASSSVRETPQT